jgi:hypothetical protein
MQITKEKPQIDVVFEAHIRVNRQKIKQKNRYTDAFDICSCLTEFETANFEIRNPEMKYLISFNTSTPSDNTCKVEEPGLNILNSLENNSSNLNLELSETGLQIVTGWTTEPRFCPLVREDWN